MATGRADELREAFLQAEPERYDVQFNLKSIESYRAEEVVIYSNYSNASLRLVPLPTRRASLQVNWQATDGDGRKLVILSKAELELLYSELFPDAINYLRRRSDLPLVLKQLVTRNDWEDALFRGGWIANQARQPEHRDALVEFFAKLLDGFPEHLGPLQAATAVFAEYVLGEIFNFYRPWIYLNAALAGSEQWDEAVQDKVLVKYCVDETIPVGAIEKVVHAVLGRIRIVALLPLAADCSTHVRVVLPKGMLFSGRLSRPEGATRFAWDREQFHAYTSAEDGLHRYREARGSPRVPFSATLSQTPSMRMIVAAFLGLLSTMPMLLALARCLPADACSSPDAGWAQTILDVLGSIWIEDITIASQLSLPLALTLVAAAWDRPAVRPYAVTQLVLALCVITLAAAAPLTIAGPLVGMGMGLLLALFNLFAGLAMLRSPRNQQAEPEGPSAKS